MIPFNEEELEGLVEVLRDQPGFITAAVVPGPAGGGALVERLREEVDGLPIEVADPRARPAALGARAADLGQTDGAVFIVPVDGRRIFKSEDESVGFWSELNYQREALGAGTVRTCLLLNAETERGLALGADDLWDWTTIFRFPESVRATEYSEKPMWSGDFDRPVPSENDLDVLRRQWQRAREAGMPESDLVETYATPLFLALTRRSHYVEATRLWERDLRYGASVRRLPPEIGLEVAREMMYLARFGQPGDHREDLVRDALAAAGDAVASLELEAAERPKSFEYRLAVTLSVSARIHLDGQAHEVALRHIGECVEIFRRLVEDGEDFEIQLVRSLSNLGLVLRKLNRRAEAVAAFEEAVRRSRHRLAVDPDVFLPEFSRILLNLSATRPAGPAREPSHVWLRTRIGAVEDFLVQGRAWLDGQEDHPEWNFVWGILLVLLPGDSSFFEQGRAWLVGREDRPEWAHVWQRLLRSAPWDTSLFDQGRTWLDGREDRPEWNYVWQRLLRMVPGDPALFDQGRGWLVGREDRPEWAHVWEHLAKSRPYDSSLQALAKDWLRHRRPKAKEELVRSLLSELRGS